MNGNVGKTDIGYVLTENGNDVWSNCSNDWAIDWLVIFWIGNLYF